MAASQGQQIGLGGDVADQLHQGFQRPASNTTCATPLLGFCCGNAALDVSGHLGHLLITARFWASALASGIFDVAKRFAGGAGNKAIQPLATT